MVSCHSTFDIYIRILPEIHKGIQVVIKNSSARHIKKGASEVDNCAVRQACYHYCVCYSIYFEDLHQQHRDYDTV